MHDVPMLSFEGNLVGGGLLPYAKCESEGVEVALRRTVISDMITLIPEAKARPSGPFLRYRCAP